MWNEKGEQYLYCKSILARWYIVRFPFTRPIHGSHPNNERSLLPIFQQFIYLEFDPCVFFFRFTVQLRISADLMEPLLPSFLLFLQRSDICKSHFWCLFWSLSYSHIDLYSRHYKIKMNESGKWLLQLLGLNTCLWTTGILWRVWEMYAQWSNRAYKVRKSRHVGKIASTIKAWKKTQWGRALCFAYERKKKQVLFPAQHDALSTIKRNLRTKSNKNYM